MRATEFLLEYNRQITAKNYGKKLYDRTIKDRSWHNFYYSFPESRYLEPEQQVERIVANLEQVDPTKNKEYMQWIVRTYINEPNFWTQDLYSTVKDYLIKFHKLKQRKMLERPNNDINSYKTFKSFMDTVDKYSDPETQQQMYSKEYNTIYEDENVRAVVPLSQDAACYLGQGTRWCTATTRSKNYFDSYNAWAPLLILLPKKPKYNGEKYQLHFVVYLEDEDVIIRSQEEFDNLYNEINDPKHFKESLKNKGQFKNEKDDSVTLKYLNSRFGGSFTNAVNSLIKYDPRLEYAINVNFEMDQVK